MYIFKNDFFNILFFKIQKLLHTFSRAQYDASDDPLGFPVCILVAFAHLHFLHVSFSAEDNNWESIVDRVSKLFQKYVSGNAKITLYGLFTGGLFTGDISRSTNHQGTINWPDYFNGRTIHWEQFYQATFHRQLAIGTILRIQVRGMPSLFLSY